MAEYYGYVPRAQNQLDFAGMTSKLTSAFQSVSDKREARRAANDKLKTDTEALINEYDLGANKTINDLVLDGANSGRDKLYEWDRQLKAREIKPADYRAKVNALKDSWGVLAFSAKNLDERLLAALERQQPGEDGSPAPASSYEMYMTQDFAKNKDVSNKKIHIDDKGRVFIAAVSPYGQLDPNDIQDVTSMANIDNLVDNRIDLNTAVKEGVANWGDVKTWKDLGYGATITETDARNNPMFKEAKYDLVESIVTEDNPRSVVSILLDNSNEGYRLYKSDAEKNKIISDAIKRKEGIKGGKLTEAEYGQIVKDTEGKLIQIKQGANGNYEPVLTEQAITDAKRVVGDQIEMQLGFEKEGTPRYKVTSSGGSGDGARAEKKAVSEQEALAGYLATIDAFGGDREAARGGKLVKNKQPDFGGLNKNYSYQFKNGKIFVYMKGDFDPASGMPVKKGSKSIEASPIAVATEPNDLAQFAINGDPSEATMRYNEARSQYKGSAPTTAPKKKSDPLDLGL